VKLRRRAFLELAASIVTLPLSLHVRENGAAYTLKSTYYRPAGAGAVQRSRLSPRVLGQRRRYPGDHRRDEIGTGGRHIARRHRRLVGGRIRIACGGGARGVAGVINVDGGRGSLGSGKNCDPAQLIAVAGEFGATTKVPALWLYASNDERFSPALARQMYDAYERHRPSGLDRFVRLPAFGNDGHTLFSYGAAIPLWSPYVETFLNDVS
jgi:hypothetical protein